MPTGAGEGRGHIFKMLGIAAKYDIKSIYFSTATVKNAVWSSFVNILIFLGTIAFCMFSLS